MILREAGMPGKNAVILSLATLLLFRGEARATDPIELTEAESGRTIRGSVGQGVVVTLEGNPSTGYSWSYRSAPPEALEPVGEPEYIPDLPVRPGSGGRMRHRFTAILKGEAALRFEYRRSWEADVPPAKVVTYTLVIGGR